MAKFLLQTASGALENEERFVEQALKDARFVHQYDKVTLEDLQHIEDKDRIPIGTIEFVTAYLNKHHGIVQENPIEIPVYLRTDEFLKRDYVITTWDKLPKSGRYFIKDVSQLKNFGSVVQAEYFITDELFNHVPTSKFDSTLVLSKDHLYQVSSEFPIQSEYRVYVLQGQIECISHYNGDCTVLPDIELIKKAVSLINYHEKWLKSYTIDVMIGPCGTAVIEVHNFTSVGLYSTLWGSNLLYGYANGIDYLLNDNKKIEI